MPIDRLHKIAEANLKLTERLVEVAEVQAAEWAGVNHSLRRIVTLLEKLTGSVLPPGDDDAPTPA